MDLSASLEVIQNRKFSYLLPGLFSLKPRHYTNYATVNFTNLLTDFWDALFILTNPLHVQLNPICQFMALLGAQPFLHVSRATVNKP